MSNVRNTEPQPSSSSTEGTREVVQEWVALVKNHRYDELHSLATPNANWWVAGRKDKIPVAGDMPYNERAKLLGDVFAKADWYTTDVVSLIVEGDSAAMEVLRKAQGPGNRHYENTAMTKFTVRDGKITEIREYLDLISFGLYLGISGIFDLLRKD
ncbi:hypothetical protein FPV67DRAFT_1216106 [Lyophyllum atratum]|nr:hypothetical protein FPV67DRAFT_1216106 [Lyophyllum atratum]